MCSDALAVQVFLDRQGFSPGEIDGTVGDNTKRALSAYLEQHDETAAADVNDCPTVEAVGGTDVAPTTTYTITESDTQALLNEPVPSELVKQVALEHLDYSSLVEEIAERFHAAPELITALNIGTPLAAGVSITVPNVEPFDATLRPQKNAGASDTAVTITKDGTARVTAADGRTIFFAPVSSGSEHDPLPLGQWKVTGVAWQPPFHYNPELFWDASPADEKAIIKPGPNNPVGVVWIAINVEHYGLHGTPEPSRIGYSQSHGCVRLTNWDAARLASLVGPGTPVTFE